MTALPKVDRAAVLRVMAQAAVRARDFERARQLRAEADRLDLPLNDHPPACTCEDPDNGAPCLHGGAR